MMVSNDGFCHAKRGLLSLRECGKHALSSCQTCGTGLCEDHQILSGYGVFCPDCAVQDDRFQDTDDERLERARYRRESGYYDSGMYYTFADSDYGAFEAQAEEGDESAQAEAAMAAGLDSAEDDSADGDDLDDSMES
ncbi:MAG: hypothetical protein AB9873_02435 [Syntrophobacteraceae bacterium]